MTLVAPSDIHSALSSLWTRMEATHTLRASLFNLIFYAEANENLPYVRSLAQSIVQRFPARILFITHHPEKAPDFLETRISLIPLTDNACDLIEIDAGTASLQKAPFLILAHLLTDLPIYLVWSTNPDPKHPLFAPLTTLADRYIFDSQTTSNLPQFARTLLSLPHTFTDLTWARIEDWRQLLTATFYTPDRLAHLLQADKIQIFYSNPPTQARYLQTWLTSQLGIHPTFELIAEEATPGSIISLEISTHTGWHFSFGRDPKQPHQVSMRFSTPESCAIPLRYLFEKGHSIVREIGHTRTSHQFLQLLTQLSHE